MRTKLVGFLFGLALLGLAACGKDKTSAPSTSGASGSGAKPSSAGSITVWWFQWAPADGLAELGKDFEAETGIAVNVEQIPLSSYQDKAFLEFGGSRTRFDILIGDSQWIGRGATKGLYLELTDWLPSVVDLKTIHPRAAKYLCEYPGGSGKWFAAPCETDAIGLAYRKDWFEDPGEKAAFQQKYGRELTVPQTWEEFRDVAQFFQRPEEKRYGCAMPSDRAYDGLTMGVQNVLWAFGGMWHEEGSTKVAGFLDTQGTVDAIEFFRELMKLGPKGAERLDYGQVLEAFTNGSTAMLLNYFAFFPDLAKKMGDKVGFFAMPKNGTRRYASLGGQGFSISTKTPPAQQELAKKFIAWFLQEPTQQEWVKKPGGFTANAAILKSDAFKAASPYNAAFAQSMDIVQDFWNVPVYNELIASTAQQLGEALDGKKSSKDALAALAAEHEKILSQAQ